MGRLRALKPRLKTMAPARGLAPMVDHTDERSRDKAAPWRAFEKTARWQRLRWDVLIRDDFVCQLCRAVHRLTAQCRELKALGRSDLITGKAPDRICDHIQPHKGDETLMWDKGNLQCLCKPCHDRHKQRADRRRGGGV